MQNDSISVQGDLRQDDGPSYDAAYYENHCGDIPYERNDHWLRFFSGIAENLIRSFKPQRVFDAGCGWGFLVEAFWDRSVEAWGRDISDYAISKVRRDVKPYCTVGSLTDPIEGHFELITCIEVLEHMPEAEAKQAIEHMCRAGDVILFSSTPSDLAEESHVNVQPVIYWLRLFRQHGFAPDILYDCSYISPHAFLVRRQAETALEAATSDATLVLFSEKLRWQREWVTAHQNFCRTSDSLQAFMAKNAEMSRLVNDLSGLRDTWRRNAEQLQLTLQEWMEQNVELRRELHGLKDVGVERDLWQKKTETAQKKTEEIMAEREGWIVRANHLTDKLSSAQMELKAVYASPGWQFILKYRNWVYSNRGRRPWIRKYFEPAALWFMRRVGVGAGSVSRKAEVPAPPGDLPGPAPLGSATVAAPNQTAEFDYDEWLVENEPDSEQLLIQRRFGSQFAQQPVISAIVPVYKVPLDVVRELVESVLAQTYEKWELCFAHAWPDGRDVRNYLGSLAKKDARIKVMFLEENKGISANSTQAFALASGEYVALLDHDDTLAPFAFFEVVRALNENPTIDFIYSDKDQLKGSGAAQRTAPLFKPKWSPDIMLSANYLTHLCVMRAETIRAVGGWRSETDGAQDWDLFLRVIAAAPHVHHIPKVLYHWRQIKTSVASGGLAVKPYASAGQARALRDYCAAQGWNADVHIDADGLIRIAWKTGLETGVSIVFVPRAEDAGLAERAKRLLESGTHSAMEVVVPVAGNVSSNDARVKIAAASGSASLAGRLNAAVRQAKGDILVFIDEGAEPAGPDWLGELVGPLQNASVGMVGAKLLDPVTGVLRHAGLVFTREGDLDQVFAGEPEHVCAEFGSANWYRTWSAVSGACFSIRRQTLLALGGFSEEPQYPRLDVDLCLKLQFQAKLRVVYNPFARFFQGGSAAIESWLWSGTRTEAAAYIEACFPDGDPYFNPNLTVRDGKVCLRRRSSSADVASPRGTDYSADSRILVRAFDFTEAHVRESKALCGSAGEQRLERLTWFLPEFTNPFYGGIHTILRFADYFSRKYNIWSTFAVLGRAHPQRMRQRIASAFPEFARRGDVVVIASNSQVNELPACDASISTLWTTAYAALHFRKTRRKFYFLQDYEPLFYPAGSTSALVQATYDFGYYGICNTAPLKDLYAEHGGEAEYFDPCIDPAVFHAEGRRRSPGKPYLVFCYARPGHPRNSFELVTAALKIVKQNLGDDVRIVTAGADWDPKDYGVDGVLQNLGLLGYATTGALYRACDVGVVMMMTCHPSYLPLEMMASGCLVVTNRNANTKWLLRDGENCLLAEGSASSLAERILDGLGDQQLRQRITRAAEDLVLRQYSDWDAQAEKVYQCLLRQA